MPKVSYLPGTAYYWLSMLGVEGLTSDFPWIRSQPSGTLNQAAALEAEGVTVHRDAMGELSVDLTEFGWFPRRLPSAEGEGSSSEDYEDDDDE